MNIGTMVQSRILPVAAVAAVTMLAVPAAIAGPLDPPNGTPTSTGKNVVNYLPGDPLPGGGGIHDIDRGGSYTFNGNIQVAPSQHNDAHRAVDIQADNVTVDMNGFTLENTESGASAFEINSLGNVTVRNGTIKGFSHAFFSNVATGAGGRNIVLENLTICGGKIDLTAFSNVVLRNVVIKDVPSSAIELGDNACLENVRIVNSQSGITAGTNTMVTRCNLQGDGTGMLANGCDLGANANVSYTNVSGYSGVGIFTESGNVSHCNTSGCFQGYGGITDVNYSFCNASGCTDKGYDTVTHGRYWQCTSNSNGATGELGEGSTCTGMTAYGNTGPLYVSGYSQIKDCAFTDNSGNPLLQISLPASGSNIKDCSFRGPFMTNAVDCAAHEVTFDGCKFSGFVMALVLNGNGCMAQRCTYGGVMGFTGGTGNNPKVADSITHPNQATTGRENFDCN